MGDKHNWDAFRKWPTVLVNDTLFQNMHICSVKT